MSDVLLRRGLDKHEIGLIAEAGNGNRGENVLFVNLPSQ